jgi:hypothetical protein
MNDMDAISAVCGQKIKLVAVIRRIVTRIRKAVLHSRATT